MVLPIGISAGFHLMVGGVILVSSLSNSSLEPVGMSVVMVDLVTVKDEIKDKVKVEAKAKANKEKDEVKFEAEAKDEAKANKDEAEVKVEGSDDSMGPGPDVMHALVSEQAPAHRPGGMGAGGEERKRFLREVKDRLEKAKRYPWPARFRGQEGTVRLEFVINAEGKAGGIRLVESSRWPILNEEAIATVERVDRFPGPPRGWNREVSILVPLVFRLEGDGRP